MSLSVRSARVTALVAVTGVAALVASRLSLADDPVPAAPKPAAAAAETPAADPFAVPEANDAETIAQFVQGLVQDFQTRGAEFRSQEGTIKYLNNMDAALAKVLGKPLEEGSAVLAATVRQQVLGVLAQLQDPTAAKRRDEFLASLKKSDIAGLKIMAEQVEISDQLQKLPDMKPEDRSKLIESLATKLQEKELRREYLGLATQAADTLEAIGQEKEAAAAYELYAKYLEARGEERLKDAVDGMRATARRLNLPGNPIEIKGTTVDGKPFDIKDLKGKVVLVDFWATWCGPCIAEMPNVKENYTAYHDKGFEVVGISLDDDPSRLQSFLKDQEIPWVTLFPENEGERGWENPIARHYGISGIPTVILVNQEGNVISLNARGPMLAAQLAELLGPAEPKPEPPKP